MQARLVAVVLLACACITARSAGDGARPNIIVIVVDTLRADRLGVYGNRERLTPFLDQVAQTGVVFANAYAPSSWTCPSIASLFTSRYASQHGVNTFEARLPAAEVTLAELLAQHGYLAGGFSANFRMDAALGYADGFAHWRAFMPARSEGNVRGEVLRHASRSWLQPLIGAGKGPVLLYLQYMETHAPYEPAAPYRDRFLSRGDPEVDPDVAMMKMRGMGTGRKGLTSAEMELLVALYDGTVASVDAEIRDLFTELSALGFLRHAIVVITSDHGEEFGEHGEVLHGLTLFDTAIRVPLIVAGPGVPRGKVVPEVVSLIDVAPTLLELLDLPSPPAFEGRSLVSLMRREGPADSLWTRVVGPTLTGETISELEYGGSGPDIRVHARAIVRGTQKVVVTRADKTVAYDLQRDPDEMQPWEPAAGSAPAALRAWLDQKRATLVTRASAAQPGPALDEATKEKLRALGYQP